MYIIAMSSLPIKYSLTTSAAMSFLDIVGDFTRTARAPNKTGVVEIQRGRGAWRLCGGHFHLKTDPREWGRDGGHGAREGSTETG
jgi:hypothetical protein